MSKRRGFTLVELTIVILILGILAAIVVARVRDGSTDAYVSLAKTFEKSLQNAVSLYFANRKQPPANFNKFVGYSQQSSNMNIVKVSDAIRSQLMDPYDDVGKDSHMRIHLEFKNGLVADYVIGEGGTITASYAGPGVD